MIDGAELIVRATALGYGTAPADPRRTIFDPNSTVRFRVEEVLKGAYPANELVLHGALSNYDDYNDRAAPYDFVRPGGRYGNCYATEYRSQAQFLLVLQRTAAVIRSQVRASTEYTAEWHALAPTNEQLSSTEDPWLLWVRNRVSRK
jgi:hypothetical protein